MMICGLARFPELVRFKKRVIEASPDGKEYYKLSGLDRVGSELCRLLDPRIYLGMISEVETVPEADALWFTAKYNIGNLGLSLPDEMIHWLSTTEEAEREIKFLVRNGGEELMLGRMIQKDLPPPQKMRAVHFAMV